MDAIVDIDRCANDFVFFCDNYCKVEQPNGEIVLLKLYEYQKSFINAMENNRFLIATKFRQGGFTTLGAAWFLWNCTFQSNQSCMILNRTDLESSNCMNIVKTIIKFLPDSLKPQIDKENIHDIFFKNGSWLSSRKFETAKGRAITKLFINEAAYFKDMEFIMKCLHPCITGNCCVVSTPYENKGWFYETHKDALQRKNLFTVWGCSYKEHPKFKLPEWQEKTRRIIGQRSWRKEFLQEFVPNDSLQFLDKDQEESFLLKNDPELLEKVQRYSKEEIKYSFQKNTDKPQVVNFKEHTKEEIKKIFLEEHEKWNPDSDKHPEIDSLNLNNSEELFEFWNNYSQLFPEYKSVAQYWGDIVRGNNRYQEEVERKVDCFANNDLLCAAGIINQKEKENSINVLTGEIDIIAKVMENNNFPKTMKLTFLENRLCINGAATWITEESIESAYYGLSMLLSHKKAVEILANIINNKLKRLF